MKYQASTIKQVKQELRELREKLDGLKNGLELGKQSLQTIELVTRDIRHLELKVASKREQLDRMQHPGKYANIVENQLTINSNQVNNSN